MRKYLLHRLMSPYYNGFPQKLQEGGAADFRTKIGKAAQNLCAGSKDTVIAFFTQKGIFIG